MSWEDTVEPEWLAWYDLTPEQRWAESQKLWQTYLQLGGSLDPDPDPQSPFYDPEEVPATSSLRISDAEMTRRWAAEVESRRPAQDRRPDP